MAHGYISTLGTDERVVDGILGSTTTVLWSIGYTPSVPKADRIPKLLLIQTEVVVFQGECSQPCASPLFMIEI